MSDLVLYALLGLGAGAVFALLAVGLIVQWQASNVVNFAYGAMAMLCAYCFSELRTTGDLVLPVIGLPHRLPLADGGLALGPALATTLVYGALLGVVVHAAIFRWLRHAPALAKVVASIGLMLALQAVAVLHFGTSARPTPPVFAGGNVEVLGASVGQDRLLVAGIAVLLAVGLTLLYRFTRFGVVTRAAAQNERAASCSSRRRSRPRSTGAGPCSTTWSAAAGDSSSASRAWPTGSTRTSPGGSPTSAARS